MCSQSPTPSPPTPPPVIDLTMSPERIGQFPVRLLQSTTYHQPAIPSVRSLPILLADILGELPTLEAIVLYNFLVYFLIFN